MNPTGPIWNKYIQHNIPVYECFHSGNAYLVYYTTVLYKDLNQQKCQYLCLSQLFCPLCFSQTGLS